MSLRQRKTPWRVVVGVLSTPGSRRARDALRATSHNETGAVDALAVFVLGDVECARAPTASEAAVYGDIVYVNASDCKKWRHQQKVHAWYKFAVRRWPAAAWYAKAEDDGLLRIGALLADLGALDEARPWYYGNLAWTSYCARRDACDALDGASTCCSASYCGALVPYPKETATCLQQERRAACTLGGCHVPPWAPTRGAPRRASGGACVGGLTVSAPFAVGPVEARSRRLAVEVAECARADAQFVAFTRIGERFGELCNAGDSTQALALHVALHDGCAHGVHLADAKWKRLSYPHSASRAAVWLGGSGSGGGGSMGGSRLAWVHPSKGASRPVFVRLWRVFAGGAYVPQPLDTYRMLVANATAVGRGRHRKVSDSMRTDTLTLSRLTVLPSGQRTPTLFDPASLSAKTR